MLFLFVWSAVVIPAFSMTRIPLSREVVPASNDQDRVQQYTDLQFLNQPANKSDRPYTRAVATREFNYHIARQAFNAKAKTAINLEELGNYQYVGQISPPNGKPFTVAFDQTTAYSWLPGVSSCGDKCLTEGVDRLLVCETSATCTAQGMQMTIRDEFSELKGEVVKQDLQLDSDAVVKAASLVLVNDVDSDVEFNADGVLGLACASDDVPKSYTPFVSQLKQQNLIDELSYSFYFSKSKEGSALVFGKPQQFYMNEQTVTTHPSLDKDDWVVQLDGISLGQSRISLLTNGAVVDPQVSAIVLDVNSAMPLLENFDQLNITCSVISRDDSRVVCRFADEERQISINDLPALTFHISGKDYTLDANDYVSECGNYDANRPNTSYCALDVAVNEDIQVVVLGNTFMRKYYTVFFEESNSVGFALAAPSGGAFRTAYRHVRAFTVEYVLPSPYLKPVGLSIIAVLGVLLVLSLLVKSVRRLRKNWITLEETRLPDACDGEVDWSVIAKPEAKEVEKIEKTPEKVDTSEHAKLQEEAEETA